MQINLLYHLLYVPSEARIGFKLDIGENFYTGKVVGVGTGCPEQ